MCHLPRPPVANQLKSAQAVRVRNREIRDTAKMSRKDIRKLGYTYSIRFSRSVRGGPWGEGGLVPTPQSSREGKGVSLTGAACRPGTWMVT